MSIVAAHADPDRYRIEERVRNATVAVLGAFGDRGQAETYVDHLLTIEAVRFAPHDLVVVDTRTSR